MEENKNENRGTIEPELTKAKNKDEMKWKKWYNECQQQWLRFLDVGPPTVSFKPFSISVVPDELRKWKEDAYEPKVVSMGPRYRGNRRDLLQMEETKWLCTLSLAFRLDTEYPNVAEIEVVFEEFSKEVWSRVESLRSCYTEEISLDRTNLATLLLYDSCFLLELLISGSKELNARIRSPVDIDISSQVRRTDDVLTDLMLMENQIPLAAVVSLSQHLFPHAFGHVVDEKVLDTFKDMALSLLGYSSPHAATVISHRTATHFLELVHSSIFLGGADDHEKVKREGKHKGIMIPIAGNEEQFDGPNRCVTRLCAAGVTIKLPPDTQRANKIRKPILTVSSFNFDIKFDNRNGVLEIPQLHVTEATEALWRNFIAWEHHKRKWKSMGPSIRSRRTENFRCKCTSAALLFNGLICCSSDVQLLKNKQVIVDHLNMSNRDLVEFFRSITKGVDCGIVDHSFSKMVSELNTYSATNMKATQILLTGWHYLTKIPEGLFYSIIEFLGRGYNFAATFALILTVVQTLYAVLSYHHPQK